MQCANCKSDTTNPKFCSRSCSAQYNNRAFPKKKKTVVMPNCTDCGVALKNKRSKKCSICHHKNRLEDKTLGEVIYIKHHKSSAFALVRTRARASLPFCPCKNCGYDKHTEVCHIKPIKDFSMDTLISEINSPANLIRLCPNCHWEFDRGRLLL